MITTEARRAGAHEQGEEAEADAGILPPPFGVLPLP